MSATAETGGAKESVLLSTVLPAEAGSALDLDHADSLTHTRTGACWYRKTTGGYEWPGRGGRVGWQGGRAGWQGRVAGQGGRAGWQGRTSTDLGVALALPRGLQRCSELEGMDARHDIGAVVVPCSNTPHTRTDMEYGT